MADLNRQQVKIENKICSGNPDSRKQSLKNDFKSGDPPSRVLIVSPAQVDRAMSRYVTTDEKVHEGDDKSLPIKTGPTIKQRIDKRADAKAIDTENVTDEDNLYSDASSDVGIIIRDLHKPTVQVRRNQSILEGQKKLSRQERKIVKGRTNTLETFSKRQKRRTARGEIPAEEEYIGGSAIIDCGPGQLGDDFIGFGDPASNTSGGNTSQRTSCEHERKSLEEDEETPWKRRKLLE